MIAVSRAVRLCGTDELDAPVRLLRTGPLSVEFQNGALRYVRFDGIEVLRGIAFLVRDENWGTFMPEITDLQVEEGSDRFVVSYRATCSDAKRRLLYRAHITGTRDGALDFEVVATAQTDVLTNRTGFVVLHPAALAGQELRIAHVNGEEVIARFPKLISPAQPFFNIRALCHEIRPAVWADCRMQGDAYEMEDQRNWSDASFKTYVRPLSLPWPYTLAKGSQHVQSVRLCITGNVTSSSGDGTAQPVTVTVGGRTGSLLPQIGIGVPADEAGHALASIELLRRLAPRHLICQVDGRDGRSPPLAVFRRLGEALAAELALEVVIPDAADAATELGRLAADLAAVALKPARVAVSTASDLLSWQPGQPRPEQPTPEVICAAARKVFPEALLGGGMFSYFTELNRKRPAAGLFDYISHTTCPIVHAADDRSVMETLESLPAIIASTQAFIAGTPYRVGPSAISCRDNPYGKAPFENPGNGRVCLAAMDPRQRGLFGAAFALGYVAAFARGGVEAVALGAPTGPSGFIHRRTAYPQPGFDELPVGTVYPAFHVMAGLARGSGRPLLAVERSCPSAIDAIAWHEGERTVLWLVNLTDHAVTIKLSGMQAACVAVVDATSFERAIGEPDAVETLSTVGRCDPIILDAYAVARIT